MGRTTSAAGETAWMRVMLLVGVPVCLVAAAVGAAFLFVRDTSIPITVDGTGQHVAEGSTLAEAIERLGIAPAAGDLVSVTGDVLRANVFRGHVRVNGRGADPSTKLASGDRLEVVDGRTRRERTVEVVRPVPGGFPASPQYTLARYPAMRVDQGRVSGELDLATAEPSGVAVAPNEVALTFDDGPAKHTRAVLETLRKLRAPATFFFIGNRVASNPKLVRRAHAYGMAVENHSYSHPYSPPFNRRERAEIDREIAGGADAIASFVAAPKLFRPPGGTYSPLVEEVARSRGQRLVLWSVDPEDWRSGAMAAQIARRVLRDVRPGSIVLLHDGPGERAQTVRALPAIVRGIRARGLRLVLVEPG